MFAVFKMWDCLCKNKKVTEIEVRSYSYFQIFGFRRDSGEILASTTFHNKRKGWIFLTAEQFTDIIPRKHC